MRFMVILALPVSLVLSLLLLWIVRPHTAWAAETLTLVGLRLELDTGITSFSFIASCAEALTSVPTRAQPLLCGGQCPVRVCCAGLAAAALASTVYSIQYTAVCYSSSQ